MTNCGQESRPKPLPGSVLGLAAALAIAGAVAFAASKPAGALQAYTEKTGLSCGRCHTSSAGGGALTAFGKEYVANGHKVPKKEKTAGKKTVAEPAPATPAITEVEPGRALDYIPWTLSDPYYSHFLYRSDDYSK